MTYETDKDLISELRELFLNGQLRKAEYQVNPKQKEVSEMTFKKKWKDWKQHNQKTYEKVYENVTEFSVFEYKVPK